MNRLVLRDFRRVARADIELHPGTNLFFGANAQGKTTILEAAAMLSLGRSFRASRDRECIAWNAPSEARFASVDAYYVEEGAQRRLRLAVESGKKTVFLDGKQLRALSELWGHVRTVTFAPADLRLVQDGPHLRRAVLDTVLGQIRPGYLTNLGAYNKALASRNVLIRERTPDSDARYDAFEAGMAQSATRVMEERRQIVRMLGSSASDAVTELTESAEELKLTYEPGLKRDCGWGEAENLGTTLKNVWTRERRGDLERGFTRHGPHRDDLKFELSGVDARAYASQGQARTCALALRLAELAVHEEQGGRKPVLLLDDILGELDRERSNRFLSLVAGRNVQTLLTATDALAVESSLHVHRRFTVCSGEVIPA